MRIVITGGHFSPAYSVIQKIKSDNDILVVGRKYAFEGEVNETYEYKVCQRERISFKEINAGRLQRKFTLHSVPPLLRFPRGIYSAYKILMEFKPDVIVTFGGYVGLPVAVAASLLRIPVVLHEQTQRAGLASKAIARIARVVCLSYEASREYFKNANTVLTGNPLRSEIFEDNALPLAITKPFIYITGGSTGAHFINETIYSILPELLNKYSVVHQTGNAAEFNDFATLTQFKKTLSLEYSKKYTVSEFFSPQEVASFFQNAVLVISRSGANTVLELMATGAVGLLIPLPHGQKSEQKDNAKLYVNTGMGEFLEQKDVTREGLVALIHAMINNREKYAKKAADASKYVHQDAADKIIEQIELYGKRGSSGVRPT
ncbi:MAG: UDP-N-acetylglucosamine--N-acetylmuramyl-(pentapeptide) pyrophosphoryl-undecaprenol N-acetylglucosamine transferase [Candidatus Levybacteria bacterium]|nr:UDP-N-acetylglucosamine--N-acetylmuramyl-(pentapeptide) pyrophosphoryl-undecaprenol N-acetylglucosamine transferase [Candidatus Levybacteria bacterium]